MENQSTHYDVLQVSERATSAVIRASYKALIQQYHPDRFDPVEEAVRITQMLNEAFAVLHDPVRRKTYDEALAAKRHAEARPSESDRKPSSPPPFPHAEHGGNPKRVDWRFWVMLCLVAVLTKVFGLWLFVLWAVTESTWRLTKHRGNAARLSLSAGALVICLFAWIGFAVIVQPPPPSTPEVQLPTQATATTDWSPDQRVTDEQVAASWAETQERFHTVRANRFIRAVPGAFGAWEQALQQVFDEHTGAISDWALMQEARDRIAPRFTAWKLPVSPWDRAFFSVTDEEWAVLTGEIFQLYPELEANPRYLALFNEELERLSAEMSARSTRHVVTAAARAAEESFIAQRGAAAAAAAATAAEAATQASTRSSYVEAPRRPAEPQIAAPKDTRSAAQRFLDERRERIKNRPRAGGLEYEEISKAWREPATSQ